MYLEIVSPEKVLLSAEVTSVTVPGVEGEFQMLNNHAPIVSVLAKGVVKVDGNFEIAEEVTSPVPSKVTDSPLIVNVPEFEKAASGSGTVSVAEEPDGIIRRVPLVSNVAGKVRPTLGLDMIRVAFKGNSIATRTGMNGVEEIIIQTKAIGNAAIPTDENGRVWIYYGESDSSKVVENKSRYYVSAVDIIKSRVEKDRLKGKLGILGTSATGLKDIRPTPVDDRMPGVEIHANLIGYC